MAVLGHREGGRWGSRSQSPGAPFHTSSPPPSKRKAVSLPWSKLVIQPLGSKSKAGRGAWCHQEKLSETQFREERTSLRGGKKVTIP